MEKNPVFELSEESPPSDRNGRKDTSHMRSSIQAPQKKVSGRVLALAVVAMIAILVLGGVVALVVFRPSTSESSSDKQEIESLKQQLENLRQLVSRLDQSMNNTYLSYGIQNEAIRALQSQAQISREETSIQLQNFNKSVLDLQTDFQVTKQIFADNVTVMEAAFENARKSLLNRLDQSVNNTHASNRLQDETIRALMSQAQISQEATSVQLQKFSESVLDLQTDFWFMKQIFAENITDVKAALQTARQSLLNHLDQHINNTYMSNNMQDETIKALQLQVNITRQISNEEWKNQLQTYNETVAELQVELQNVLADVQSSRKVFEENITAVHLVMQELSTTQVNITHKLQYLQTHVLQRPSIQVNTSESKQL